MKILFPTVVEIKMFRYFFFETTLISCCFFCEENIKILSFDFLSFGEFNFVRSVQNDYFVVYVVNQILTRKKATFSFFKKFSFCASSHHFDVYFYT